MIVLVKLYESSKNIVVALVYESVAAKNLIPSVTHYDTLFIGPFIYFFGMLKTSSVRICEATYTVFL